MRFTTLFATVVTASATANALAFTESFGAIKRDMVKRVVAPSGPGSGGSGSGGGGGGGGTGSGGQGSGGGTTTSTDCPAIWTTIGAALRVAFFDNTTLQCNDNARAAIRAAFHDCGTWNTAQGLTGGCDGSLVLANESGLRSENDGLQGISTFYTEFRTNFSDAISMADLIQVGGAVAIGSCPGGPAVQTFTGRKDWTVLDAPAPMGLLPDVDSNATVLIALFADKGFSAADLATLVGAHSTSRQSFVDPELANESQDSTPGIWDVQFYSDTLTPEPGVFVFPSDTALMNDPNSGPTFISFQGSQHQNTWSAKFAPLMTQISLLGLDGSVGLIDCSAVLPAVIPLATTGGGTGGTGGGPPTKRSSFSSPKFNAHPLKRNSYQNYHKR